MGNHQTHLPYIRVKDCRWIAENQFELTLFMADEFGHSTECKRNIATSEVGRMLISSYKYKLKYTTADKLPIYIGVYRVPPNDSDGALAAIRQTWPYRKV